jgi:hypothetical protein
MKLRLVVLVALATAVLPATVGADPATGSDRVTAVRTCKALRASLGVSLFAQSFNANSRARAYGLCVTRMTKAAHQARHAAQQTCGAQKLTGRALRACVTRETRTEVTQQATAFTNAAKDCQDERSRIGTAAFNQKYGTNRNDRNAFGKCVSGKVSQGGQHRAQVFRVALTQQNNSGVSGTATLRLRGTQLTVTISAIGLTPNQLHVQHIHVGASCASAGDPVLHLTPFPSADEAGRIKFTQTYTIGASVLPLTDRTINLHGMIVGGTYDPAIIVACGAID